MVKVIFRPYGYGVHDLLHAEGFAPKLCGHSERPEIGADAVVMEYLPPPNDDKPGWETLHDLFSHSFTRQLVVRERVGIRDKLLEIVSLLQKLHMIHGDFRPSNLMIKVTANCAGLVQPVRVMVVDMEWAGKVGEAYYPLDRNETVGYPGKASCRIGADDDVYMVNRWWDEINNA